MRANHITLAKLGSSTMTPCLWPLILAALLRLAYLFVVHPPFESVYWDLATSLLRDGSLAVDGHAVTDFEPLYPIFLAAARLVSRDHVLIVQMFQAVMASAGTIYSYRLVHALTSRRQVAVIAASLYALDPLLVRQAAAPAESALVTMLLIVFTYCFVASDTTASMLRAGLALGLVILTRMMTAPLAGFSLALLILQRRFRAAFALTVAVLVLLLPFSMRNRSLNGSWWPTRSGLNLYIGNSPYTAVLLPDYDLDILEDHAAELIAADLSQFPRDSPEFNRAADVLLTRHSVDYMMEDPLRSLRQKALNCLYFFSPRLVPYYVRTPETRAVIDRSGHVVVENPKRRPIAEHIAYSAFYAPVLVAALMGVCIRRRHLRQDALLWCVVANFVAIYALYFPATRYRAPMEFVLLLYAAVALEKQVSSWKSFHHTDQRFNVE